MSIGAGTLKTQNVFLLREAMVRKIIIIVFILLVLFLQYTKPVIRINNMTHDDVFVFWGAGEKDVEPDYDQIKQSRRSIKIPQGKSIELSLSISDYFLKNGQVNIGWRVGGLEESAIKRVGYNTFNIISGIKYCSLDINVKSNKDETFYKNSKICIKSLEITSNDNN